MAINLSKQEKNQKIVELTQKMKAIQFTDNYIIGGFYQGEVYYKYGNFDDLPVVLSESSSKNGGGIVLRYPKNSKKREKELFERGLRLCSEREFFDKGIERGIANRGHIFECLITELLTEQVWERDNVPFYKGADLTVNGIAYSIKFEKATIATERTILKALALKETSNN